MKRCPKCNSTFTNDSLKYCFDDGATLTSDVPRFDRDAETLKGATLQPGTIGLEVVVQLEGKGRQIFRNDQFAGTRGEGRGLEGFQLRLDPPVEGLSLKYMAHLEGIGDKTAREGEWLGARKGESCRLEGFSVELTGPLAESYNVSYMAHIRGLSDTAVFKNGDYCGTRKRGLRVEGVQVSLSPVSEAARLTNDPPRFGAEAETPKNVPTQPEMSPQDIIMEIADHLRKTVSPGEQTLIRFEPLTGLRLSITQISEHFIAAAERADCEVIDKTGTRSTVRRQP